MFCSLDYICWGKTDGPGDTESNLGVGEGLVQHWGARWAIMPVLVAGCGVIEADCQGVLTFSDAGVASPVFDRGGSVTRRLRAERPALTGDVSCVSELHCEGAERHSTAGGCLRVAEGSVRALRGLCEP